MRRPRPGRPGPRGTEGLRPTAPQRAAHGVEALTPSELRVARLAADGRTNREIAQALYVTLKTVEGHLARVYGKLSIGSRSELRQGLEGEKTRGPTLAKHRASGRLPWHRQSARMPGGYELARQFIGQRP